VGSTWRVTAGATSPASVASYQWIRDGVPIAGATRSSYKAVSADRGRLVSVAVTHSAPGYNPLVRVVKSAFTVLKAAKESLRVKAGKRQAKFAVKVSPKASKHHRGTITVRDETGKKVKGASITSGSVTFTAKHLKKGTHHYTVLYLSSSYACQKTVKVKIT
jgi:hypothetical protein